MDTLNKLFEDLSEVDDIVQKSNQVVETALALSEDDAKAVVILCLALAKTCADSKISVKTMIPSVVEMYETYLLEEEDPLKSGLDSN